MGLVERSSIPSWRRHWPRLSSVCSQRCEPATNKIEGASISEDGVAVIIPKNGPQFTYSQLQAVVDDFQRQIAAIGVDKGDAVSMALPNGLEFTVAFLGSCAQRGIAAPLNPAYKKAEYEFYIDDLKSKLVLVPRGFVARDDAAVQAAAKYGVAVAEVYWDGKHVQVDLKVQGKGTLSKAPINKPHGEDIGLVVHTSGTTGRPKAVPLLQRNLTRTMTNIVNTYKLTPKDRTLLVMPLFHVHGLLCGLLATFLAGASAIIPDKFSAGTFWRDFVQHKANWYTAVPTMHQILLRTALPKDVPQIRFIRSCSSALAPSTLHELEKTFKAPVLEAYAMSEAAHQMTSNPLPPLARKPGSVGIGQGVEVAILDLEGNVLPVGKEGEISIKGANVTPGYLNNDKANKESFTKEGWFRTGDQGKLDNEGYVFITGRIKELINRGGEKISPIELDGALLSHPAVGEAVAFGIPSDFYGQEVAAVVVLKDGQKVSEKELQEFMADKVAKFKVPKVIYFTDAIPKTGSGKIQRRVVAEKMHKPAKSKL
jgi:acyl-CoA synthetase (AMP-forming)/AMP-acid ligase II